jgi:hypothetical protein
MNEERPLTDVERDELILKNAQILHRTLADTIELAARIDGLEVLLASLGSHVGIDPNELVSKLRKVQATVHQKRLQMIEELNPLSAALLDTRSEMPPIDEELLRQMEIGDWPKSDE